MSNADTDVLIVGGGAAGLEVAFGVRKRAPTARVMLVSLIGDQVYRPWQIFLPWDRVPVGSLRLDLAQLAESHGFSLRVAEVREIDPARSTAAVGEDTISFTQLVVAAGAPADRDRIPGADEHALFPCELADARALADRIDKGGLRKVVFVLAGERVGPGLEYAGWLARGARETGAEIEITVVSVGATVARHLGARGLRKFAATLESWGGTLLHTERVEEVGPDTVRLADDRVVPADLCAVVGPLRGPDLRYTEDLTDAAGFLIVDETLRSPAHPHVHSAGDALSAPHGAWRRSWLLSIRQAETVASNVAACLQGGQVKPFDAAIAQRLAHTSVPDIGGQAYLVVGPRLVASGRLVRRLRTRMDRLHFARYTGRRPATQRPG